MLDPLPLIDELKEFDSRVNYIKANQEAIANNCEKLNQLIEKILNERNYWSRPVHLGYFTAQLNFAERNESIKVKLNEFFVEKRHSVDEIARFLCKSDGLQTRLEAFDEWRKVNLDVFEDLPLFDKYIKENYTDYAVNRIRYNAAVGFNTWKIKDIDTKAKVYLLISKQEVEDD